MGRADDRFSIDPDELDAVIRAMENSETALLSLTGDLERQIRTLHDVWEGLAARAQKEAQEEWDQGFRLVKEALADIRRAARQAHRNYTGAASTNKDMWRQVT